jgi:hypothetical protein
VTKMRKVLISGICVGIGCGLLYSFLPQFYVWRLSKNINRRVTKVLFQSDYRTLLYGCRQILSDASSGKLASGTYEIRTSGSENAYKFPQIILSLDPTYIHIEDNTVLIELAGGLSHCGLFMSLDANSFSGDHKHFQNMNLIDGLWYYDDGFLETPNWAEKLKKLKPKDATSLPPLLK